MTTRMFCTGTMFILLRRCTIQVDETMRACDLVPGLAAESILKRAAARTTRVEPLYPVDDTSATLP